MKAVRSPIEWSVVRPTPLRDLVDGELLRRGAVYVSGRRGEAATICVRGDRVRVHANPRRFESTRPPSVVASGDGWLVVDKPEGIPVHGTCDNAVENLIHVVSAMRGERLSLCHRLDVGTSGLVVLARTLAFRTHFGRCLDERRIEKRYEARIGRPVAPGDYRHYQPRRTRAPFSVEAEPSEKARVCELRIGECRPDGAGWIVSLEPRTGRQHQLRAQLAFLGAPIEGDVLYGAPAPLPCPADGEAIALRAVAIAFPDLDGTLRRIAAEPLRPRP